MNRFVRLLVLAFLLGSFGCTSLANAGTATTYGYFYKPAYGEKGATAYTSYNAALDATDIVLHNMAVAYAAYASSATIDPGHKHSKLWASDGDPEAIDVSSGGIVQVKNILTVYPDGFETYSALIFDKDSGTGALTVQAQGITALSTEDLCLQKLGGNVGIGTLTPGSKLSVVGLPTYADNAAALAGGLTAGDCYRTSTGVLMVVYTP